MTKSGKYIYEKDKFYLKIRPDHLNFRFYLFALMFIISWLIFSSLIPVLINHYKKLYSLAYFMADFIGTHLLILVFFSIGVLLSYSFFFSLAGNLILYSDENYLVVQKEIFFFKIKGKSLLNDVYVDIEKGYIPTQNGKKEKLICSLTYGNKIIFFNNLFSKSFTNEKLQWINDKIKLMLDDYKKGAFKPAKFFNIK